jgi:hypothetical protein
MTPKEILAACRAARGTPHGQALRDLLHDFVRECRFRKEVEALRADQSQRLLSAARARDAMLAKGGGS